MNSFSAVALGSLCMHVQVPGTWEALFLVPAEEGREQDDFPVGVLVGDPSWPLGSTGDVKFTSTGSHIHEREGGVCSHAAPAYHIKPLSKVSVLKLLTAL